MAGLLDYQGAFGTGSPAEMAGQPSGMAGLLGGAYEALGLLAKRALGSSEMMRQTGVYNPEPMVEAAMLPMGTGAIAGVPMRAGEAVLGAGPIRAYHGSPHDFDRFDLSKIGTGEGAQAYGHGLYFAENEGVAKQYRNALSNWKINGGPPNPQDPSHIAAATLKAYDGNASSAIDDLIRTTSRGPQDERLAAAQAIDLIRSGKPLPKAEGGRMYEVNINADPAHFLDWDKPLREQPKAIQDLYNAKIAANLKTREIGVNPNLGPLTDVIHPEGGSLGAFTKDQLPDVLANPAKYVPARGENFYRSLHEDAIRSGKAEPAKIKEQQVVQQLREAGIPGIKYLDQGSRTAGEGSRNYVVFDDSLINILRKYGIAGLLGAPPALDMANRQQ